MKMSKDSTAEAKRRRYGCVLIRWYNMIDAWRAGGFQSHFIPCVLFVLFLPPQWLFTDVHAYRDSPIIGVDYKFSESLAIKIVGVCIEYLRELTKVAKSSIPTIATTSMSGSYAWQKKRK